MLFQLSESERSSRGIYYLLILYVGALVLAALLAPPAYRLIESWHESSPNALTGRIVGKPFHRYFDRLRWLPTLIALPFLLKACGLFSWNALGVNFRGTGMRRFLYFFAGGTLLLGLIAFIQGMYYGVEFQPGLRPGRVAAILAGALAGGFLLGLLEEIIFRGMVFRMFYTWVKPVPALLLTSLFFGYAHFKYPPALWDATGLEASWAGGWHVAFWTLFGIIKTFDFLVFFNLVLFGVVLCLLVLRYQSLMPVIGFHGGIVFAILAYTDLTTVQEVTRELPRLNPFWGSGGLRDGLMATLAFAVIIVALLIGGRKVSEEAYVDK